MSAPLRPFERFLRRAHRRNTALRLLERTGLGILGGSLAAVPLLTILLWRGGGDAMAFAVTALVVGAAVGLLWGFATRPSRMATALEADRQLGWPDLLSSAALVRSRATDDPYVAAVLWAADAHCRETSPSSLALHRLGARTWGGIGLATALVLVLALLPALAAPSQADDRGGSSTSPLALLAPDGSPAVTGSQGFVRRAHRQQDPDDPNASRIGEGEPAARVESGIDPARSSAQNGVRREASADGAGRGSGASQSSAPQPGSLNAPRTATQAKPGNAGTATAGGVGQSAEGTGDDARSGSVSGGSAAARRPPPPWASADWATRSRQAMDAVQAGRIPGAYDDVIRAYFDRP